MLITGFENLCVPLDLTDFESSSACNYSWRILLFRKSSIRFDYRLLGMLILISLAKDYNV